jgi:1-acyl-sn-glycerol-3-phosphate acyltransferase
MAQERQKTATRNKKTAAGQARPAARADGRGPSKSGAGGLRGVISGRAADWSVDDYNPRMLDAQGVFWNFMMDHYFRIETDGWHRIPDRPVLHIGVHSGGTIAIDAWLFSLQWWRRFGESRILHATAHDVLRATPGLGAYFRANGVLPPSREAIGAAFEAGHDVVLWPGGEHDALRSFAKRDRAILGGRKGFIKLALSLGVPIVPYATIGGTDTGIILSEGRGLAKLVNARQRLRTEILPFVLAPPFGIVLEILPSHIPMPAKIRYELLDPIELDPDPKRVNDQAYLARIYDEVEGSIQAGMDRLAKRRSFPIFG